MRYGVSFMTSLKNDSLSIFISAALYAISCYNETNVIHVLSWRSVDGLERPMLSRTIVKIRHAFPWNSHSVILYSDVIGLYGVSNRWIPITKEWWCGKHFNVMTFIRNRTGSSWGRTPVQGSLLMMTMFGYSSAADSIHHNTIVWPWLG